MHKKKFYESVIIFKQELSQAQVTEIMENLKTILSQNEGTVPYQEYWGLKSFSHPINKHKKGHYAFFNIEAPGASIHEFERLMKIDENILRFLTVNVQELNNTPSPMMNENTNKRFEHS